jgi:hypothetical protein
VEAGGKQGKKSSFEPVSRTADLPGQALNIDLCFVPDSHLADIKLPAVSGSSGHLVVERVKEAGQEPDYPGKVFADPNLDYAEALQAFVQASQPLFGPSLQASAVEKKLSRGRNPAVAPGRDPATQPAAHSTQTPRTGRCGLESDLAAAALRKNVC